MTNSQIEVLKIALLNVEREELRLLDSLPNENYEFSDEHKARMKRMVYKYDHSNKTMPKKLSIILAPSYDILFQKKYNGDDYHDKETHTPLICFDFVDSLFRITLIGLPRGKGRFDKSIGKRSNPLCLLRTDVPCGFVGIF